MSAADRRPPDWPGGSQLDRLVKSAATADEAADLDAAECRARFALPEERLFEPPDERVCQGVLAASPEEDEAARWGSAFPDASSQPVNHSLNDPRPRSCEFASEGTPAKQAAGFRDDDAGCQLALDSRRGVGTARLQSDQLEGARAQFDVGQALANELLEGRAERVAATLEDLSLIHI